MPKILIIDDEDAIRELLGMALRRAGYEVLKASNGKDGIQLAIEHLPDLVISDVHMSQVDGCAVLNALRTHPPTAAIPFIMMTGQTETVSIRDGMNLGADDYLAKPFAMPELLAAVKARLEKSQALQRAAEKKLEDLRADISLSLPHELLTPLTGIIGCAEILRDGLDAMDRAEIVDTINMMDQSAQRLLRLVHNHLLFAQIELLARDENRAGRFRPQLSPATAATIEAAARVAVQRHNRPADLRLQLHNGPAAMAEEHVKKITEELVDNAAKFSPAGAPIRVVSQALGNVFQLTVSDQGRGMTPEQVARLGAFQQFNRNQQEQQGMGLGLAIARRLVSLHRGKLEIVSNAAAGTTVTAQLPARF